MDNIILDTISIQGNIVKYHIKVSSKLSRFFNGKEMFIDYGESMESVPVSVLTIPFAAILSNLAWQLNASLWVDEIDETYFYSIKDLKVAYQEAHYEHPFQGRFIPSKIVRNQVAQVEQGLLLFGGGVDCHSSFLRNKDKISEIVNINGWLHDCKEENQVDISDSNMTFEFGVRMGVKAMHIRSNFAVFLNLSEIDSVLQKKVHIGHWYGFLHAMAFIGIAIPLAYKRGYSNIYIASSNTKGQNNVCASDITTDSLHRFCLNGGVIHDGFELNRQEKIKIIVDYKKSIKRPYMLHVCSFNDHNCCECEKCFRTVTSLVAENEDPEEYGFPIQDSLKEHWQKVMDTRLGLWGIDLEKRVYWPFTRERMRENYEKMNDEQKEFADWFLSFDFDKGKRDGVKKYYRKNFFKILKRKLHL